MKRLTITLLVISSAGNFHVLQDRPGRPVVTRRRLVDALRPWRPSDAGAVNIRQHGARGNGSTDDTAAIVAAFSSVCAAAGGTIYVPPGIYIIDPASRAIPICSHLVVTGPGTLRVKPDAGNYRCIFAPDPSSSVVNDLTFTGITIDQNAAGNTTATIDVDDEGTLQLIWQIFAGTNLHFEDMHLLVGGVDPIDLNGPTVSGVYIARNHIVFQKRAGQPAFDNSAVYIDGDNFHVTDNTFVSTSSDAAVTAIEIHSGSGAVVGNTIDSFAIGMNLVNLHSSSAIGNNIRNAGYGISLWSTAKLDAVTISGNTVDVAQVTRQIPSSWGIATSHTPGFNGEFSNLHISGNVLTFEPESSNRRITGSANYGIGLQTLGNVSNVMIVANQIVRAPVRGIVVGIADAGYTISRVSVRDNQIIDAGSNFSPEASNYAAGIAVQGNLASIEVVRNRLEFLSSPFIGHYSYWSRETGFMFRNVVVAGNYSTSVNGSPANGLTASVSQTYPPQ